MRENQIQYAYVKFIRSMCAVDRRFALIHHIPNGSGDLKRRIHLSNLGCVAGIPDFFIPIPKKKFHGMYLELKSARGKQSIAQQHIASELEMLGYKYVICRSTDAAIDVTLDYLEINKKNGTQT